MPTVVTGVKGRNSDSRRNYGKFIDRLRPPSHLSAELRGPTLLADGYLVKKLGRLDVSSDLKRELARYS